eukprot:197945_1
MATGESTQSLRMQNILERQKANDLQTLLSSLHNHSKQQPSLSDIQIINLIKKYFTDIQHNLQSQIQHYTLSKLKLIESTNAEINRMRYIIHEITNNINTTLPSPQHTPSIKSLSFSPIILSSPDIDMKPIDLNDIPQTFRPRRYSHIPNTYTGQYKIETVKQGNGIDYPYPNDKVTVQYTTFAIHGILDLMESYIHQVVDLPSSECMIGLKYGLLSMSINQKCKLWIPKRLTKCYINGVINTQKCDILIEIELLNIIRSDIYKNTTYTNDIILNATKQRHKRANTVSKTPPPPIVNIVNEIIEQKTDENDNRNTENIAYTFVVDNIDDKNNDNDDDDVDLTDLNAQFQVPDLKSFGGHIEHQNTDIALVEHLTEEINKTDMSALLDEINQTNKIDNSNFLAMPTDFDEDGKSVYCPSDDDIDSEGTQLLDISGMKLLWKNTYENMNKNEMVEQCMTLCAKIESCHCSKRLLMILKMYQSIMYNRKHHLWNISNLNDSLLCMYNVIINDLGYNLYNVINDFYHCRFYHGHFNQWYDFCRKHYEENYCVYEFIREDDNNGCNNYKRHCTIYKRYHRNKYKCKD